MRLSTNWLNDFVTLPDDLDSFCDSLTMAGLEVEEKKELSGADIAAAGGSGEHADTVLTIKVIPNRGDWMSVLGVARECAPLLNKQIVLPKLPHTQWTDEQIPITIQDPDLCKRYIGVVIRGIKVAPSPTWMQDRLIASGMRPINNVVDTTNYVMLELGQPLHAFDISLLQGQRIVVRRAVAGEKLVLIDGTEKALKENTLVIADANRPVAIAGVMGGFDSEITESTTDVLLESANFDSVSVRKTSKMLGMTTEASYRFERSVDPSICEYAAIRAAELLRELAGADSVGKPNDVYPDPVRPIEIKVSMKKANKMLGLDISASGMVDAISGYGILASQCEDELICRIPTFRPDITIDVDLIEEIGRGYGYEKIPMTLPNIPQQGKNSPEGELVSKLRRILMSCGMQEVLSNSIVDHELAALAGRDDIVCLRNPLSTELDSMRRMLVTNLLDILAKNQHFISKGIGIFECGKIYFTSEDTGYDESLSVAGLVCGSMWDNSWGMGKFVPMHDFFSCKGIVESILAELGIEGVQFEACEDPFLHPTRAAKVYLADKKIGLIGQIDPALSGRLDVRGEAYVFELDIPLLLDAGKSIARYSELPKFPSVSRHISMKLAENIDYEKIEAVVQNSGGELCRAVQLIDVFRGEQLGMGTKSVTISVEFRAGDRTLKDEEVNAAVKNIHSELVEKLEAVL